jgi:hypothetical protein
MSNKLWNPKGIGQPGKTKSANPRVPNPASSNCLGKPGVVALVPEKELTLTTLDFPTLLFYIPQNSAESITLKIDTNNTSYSLSIAPAQASGIYGFQLSSLPNFPALTPDQKFRWNLIAVCDAKDPLAQAIVYGHAQRVSLDPPVMQQLETAKTAYDRAAIYAANFIWHNAIATLFAARQSQPNDLQLTQMWTKLLTEIGRTDLL